MKKKNKKMLKGKFSKVVLCLIIRMRANRFWIIFRCEQKKNNYQNEIIFFFSEKGKF